MDFAPKKRITVAAAPFPPFFFSKNPKKNAVQILFVLLE